jgi:hypothetical protein
MSSESVRSATASRQWLTVTCIRFVVDDLRRWRRRICRTLLALLSYGLFFRSLERAIVILAAILARFTKNLLD